MWAPHCGGLRFGKGGAATSTSLEQMGKCKFAHTLQNLQKKAFQIKFLQHGMKINFEQKGKRKERKTGLLPISAVWENWGLFLDFFLIHQKSFSESYQTFSVVTLFPFKFSLSNFLQSGGRGGDGAPAASSTEGAAVAA